MGEEFANLKAGFIDIGTNSVRWLAAEIGRDGRPAILGRGLLSPRLGEGLAAGGGIRPDAARRTLSALEEIGERLRRLGVENPRCVATAPLRAAADREKFSREAEKRGLRVEALTGSEEAEKIFQGAFFGLPAGDGDEILADVGGGSTEIIIVRAGRAAEFLSLPLGCVALKDSFARLRSEKARLRAMAAAAVRVIETRAGALSAAAVLVGLGGTFTTLAAISLGLTEYRPEKVHGRVLSRDEIEAIRRRLEALPPARRRQVPGLEESRTDIILPGIVIAQALAAKTGAGRVRVSDRGLLFGLLAEAVREFTAG